MIKIKIDFCTKPLMGQTYSQVESLIKAKLYELWYEMEGDYCDTQFVILDKDELNNEQPKESAVN